MSNEPYRDMILREAVYAICPYCKKGNTVDNEWHEVPFTNPDEIYKVYCLATPIRNLIK